MKVLNSLAVSGAMTVASNAVWHAGNFNPANYATAAHTHSGYATAAQGTKADNALPATSYTAADVLAKLLTVDTDTAGINATTVKSITPGMGGLVLLAQANLGSGWTTKLSSAPPTTLAGWGINDAAAKVHYHQMSDISDFSAPKGREYFASPISGSVTANVNSYAGVIARMNGNVSLNFSGTIYGDYEIMIYNDSGTYRNLDLNFYNSVQTIKGSAPSTSITINHGEMYRGRFHYIYAGGDGIMGVADVN